MASSERLPASAAPGRADRLPPADLARHAGRGEGEAQHAVLGEEVGEHHALTRHHLTHQLGDLAWTAVHRVLPIIGTFTPLRRYGTSAPFVHARSTTARRCPPQPRAGARRGPRGVRRVGVRRAARRDRGAGGRRAGHGLPALPDEGGAVRGGHGGAGARARRAGRGRAPRRPIPVPRSTRSSAGSPTRPSPSAICPTRSAGSGRRPSRWPAPSCTGRWTRCSPGRGPRAPCVTGSARPS